MFYDILFERDVHSSSISSRIFIHVVRRYVLAKKFGQGLIDNCTEVVRHRCIRTVRRVVRTSPCTS